MVYFLLIINTPTSQATKQGELFASGKLAKLPDFVKRLHVFIAVDEGILSFALYETPDDKMFEAMKAINKRATGYFAIEGATFKLYPLMEIKDALALVGLG